MRLAPRRTTSVLLLASILSAAPAFAAQVTDLVATVRDGQTFLTWTSPPGTGWIYRVYASGVPIKAAQDLYLARLLGAVGDSTWHDRRLSALTGTTYSYRIAPTAEPLAPTQGLYVVTPTSDGMTYYAVTVQEGALAPEDRTITVLENALKKGVREPLQLPKPVYQRTIQYQGVTADIYTLWTTDTPTLYFPAMSNMPGLAFDCAVVPPTVSGPGSSLMVRPHPKGSHFLACLQGTHTPGEWLLALDDPLPNGDANTFWYGYHEAYNIQSNLNAPPTDGVVHDYTRQRILHTLLWMRSTFPIDPARTYAFGYSMGGIGSVMLAFYRPDLIAGVMSIVGKYDFSFLDDPNPLSAFNPGNVLRGMADRLWGEVTTNLPTNEGVPVYDRLNDGHLVGSLDPIAVPPILSFDGRWDTTVGWAEKIPFYAAMRSARQGGYFFWDNRDHVGLLPGAWSPLEDARYLYRFRSDLSFPALSNSSADGDPGTGDPLAGDSVGCINGFLEWDTTLLDEPTEWEVRLYMRDLSQRWGTATAPESAVVDVTPRRLQRFLVVAGAAFTWRVTRDADGAVVQEGVVNSDGSGVLTVPQVKVYRTGTRLHLAAIGSADVAGGSAGRLRLRLSANPVRQGTTVELVTPRAGEARVELLDVGGRVVRVLHRGPLSAGVQRLRLPTAGLASGVYRVSFHQGDARVSVPAVVLR